MGRSSIFDQRVSRSHVFMRRAQERNESADCHSRVSSLCLWSLQWFSRRILDSSSLIDILLKLNRATKETEQGNPNTPFLLLIHQRIYTPSQYAKVVNVVLKFLPIATHGNTSRRNAQYFLEVIAVTERSFCQGASLAILLSRRVSCIFIAIL